MEGGAEVMSAPRRAVLCKTHILFRGGWIRQILLPSSLPTLPAMRSAFHQLIEMKYASWTNCGSDVALQRPGQNKKNRSISLSMVAVAGT